ncbi:TPA: hypothetical protein ACH3X3_013620 [Trebouxia sp. C0006]
MRTAGYPFAMLTRSSGLLRVGSQATASFEKKRTCNQSSWKQGRQPVIAVHVSHAARVVREIREEDVEGLTCLQAKAFYDPWDNVWIDDFFLKLFEADVRGIIKSKLKDQDKSRKSYKLLGLLLVKHMRT